MSFIKNFISINYHDASPILLMWQGIYKGREERVHHICERIFITIKLLWHNYLVLSLGTRAMKLCTETSLSITKPHDKDEVKKYTERAKKA
jgi:hypothetical protein